MACPDVAGTPAQGTYVQIGNCASPEVFVTVSGAMDISGPEKQRAEIEVTNHGTPTAPQTGKSYRPTLLDFGTISFQVIWDASDTSHALLDTLIDSGEIRNFRLIDTDPSSDGKQFQAYVQKLGESYPVAGINMRSVVIRIVSAPESL